MSESQKEYTPVPEDEQLSDEQLQEVAGGLSDRFQQARIDTINQLTDQFDDARQENLDS